MEESTGDSSSASNQSSHPFAEPVDATNESLKKSVPENGENDGEYLSHPPDRRAESTSYSSNPMCGKRVDAKAKRLSSPESNPSLDVSVDVNSPREVVLMFNSDLRQAEISSPSSTCCEKMASMCSLKFKTQPILGTYATKRLFCSRAPSAKVVILNVPVESSSGSLMFKSSILTPEDVRNLRMTAALVVLPPCLSDDGLSKMTAAFLAAGAQSVLTCPQSAIISESHSTFFDYFINFLLSGDSSVCALRRAQISLHCILEFSDPIFWSDYRIVGRDVHIKVANPVDASALIKCIGLPGIASDQSCFVSIQKNIADSAETTNIHVLDHYTDEQHVLIILIVGDDFMRPPILQDLLMKKTAHIIVLFNLDTCHQWKFIVHQLVDETRRSCDFYWYKFTHVESLKRFIYAIQRHTDFSPLPADLRNLKFLASLSNTSVRLLYIMTAIIQRELEEASLSSSNLGCQQGAMRRTLSTFSMCLSELTNLGEDNSVLCKMLLRHIPLTTEENCLLQCLSLFKGTPIPSFAVEHISRNIALASSRSISYGQLINNLESEHLIHAYPPLEVHTSITSPAHQKLFTVAPIVAESIEIDKCVAILTVFNALNETYSTPLNEQCDLLRVELLDRIKEEMKRLHDFATDAADKTFWMDMLDSM